MDKALRQQGRSMPFIAERTDDDAKCQGAKQAGADAQNFALDQWLMLKHWNETQQSILKKSRAGFRSIDQITQKPIRQKEKRAAKI